MLHLTFLLASHLGGGQKYLGRHIGGDCPPLQNLVGGFNPFEEFLSNWIISPILGVKIKHV